MRRPMSCGTAIGITALVIGLMVGAALWLLWLLKYTVCEYLRDARHWLKRHVHCIRRRFFRDMH